MEEQVEEKNLVVITKRPIGKKGHSPETRAEAKELYVIEGLAVKEIAEKLSISKFTIESWVKGNKWERERKAIKKQTESSIFDEGVKRLITRKTEAVENYIEVQQRASEALKEKDENTKEYKLKFKDASSAAGTLDQAIKGEFALSEEEIPIRVMEYFVKLFIDSVEEIMDEDTKNFKPEIAQKLATRYMQKAQAFRQFWVSGGKTSQSLFS